MFIREMPPGLLHGYTVALGLIVGSFVNVLVVRLPEGKSIAWPGSQCPGCRAKIQWHDNIPVLSYLLLRGRCRSCQAPISVRYPVIELLTALVFLTAELRFGWSLALLVRDFPLLALLVAVTFIDLEHRIIPDVLSLGGLAWALITSVLLGSASPIEWKQALLGGGVGFGAFYGLAWIYWRLTGRSGLGGGDVKLLAFLGAFLGIGGVFVSIMVSSVVGSVVGVGYALWLKKTGRPDPYRGSLDSSASPEEGKSSGPSMKEGNGDGDGAEEGEPTPPESIFQASIPYGPFLVLGGLYYYLLGDLLWFRFMTPM